MTTQTVLASRWWLRLIKLCLYTITAVLGVGGVAWVMQHSGAGLAIVSLGERAASGAAVLAVVRGALGVVALCVWPAVTAYLARKNAWDVDRRRHVRRAGRNLISMALVMDLLVLNGPIWINLIRG